MTKIIINNYFNWSIMTGLCDGSNVNNEGVNHLKSFITFILFSYFFYITFLIFLYVFTIEIRLNYNLKEKHKLIPNIICLILIGLSLFCVFVLGLSFCTFG